MTFNSIEEKKEFLMESCNAKSCENCVLRTNEWEHSTQQGCINEKESTEGEIDMAIALLLKNGEQKVPVIKDSGTRREFSTGAKRDMAAGKGRMDLLPWAAIMEVSKHCENGAAKYGEHNVDKGIPTHSFCDSAARHLAKDLDGWDDEPHLLAAAWNLLWAIQMEKKHPEMVDTPWKQEGK
jgi:hypothetical protein